MSIEFSHVILNLTKEALLIEHIRLHSKVCDLGDLWASSIPCLYHSVTKPRPNLSPMVIILRFLEIV